MNDLINRQKVIDIFQYDAKILRSVLDNMDVVGRDREKYSYGLELIKLYIEDIKELQPAQSEMIKEIRKWINSKNRGSADYFIVDKIEEIINKYE